MRVKVTEKQIDQAIRRNSNHCMIADAIHKTIPNATYVSVDTQKIEYSDKKKGIRYTFLTPTKAQKAIIQFDQGKEVKPFTFTTKQVKTRSIGWRASHPSSPSRKGKTYKKTGRKNRRVRPIRKFGIRGLEL